MVDRLHCMAITFAYACKAQLRDHSIKNKCEDGADLVRRGVLTQEELDLMDKQTAWQPYYCIDALRAVINEGLLRNDKSTHPYWRLNSAHVAMESTISNLASAIGGCIRVKSTGLPVAYDDILNTMGGTGRFVNQSLLFTKSNNLILVSLPVPSLLQRYILFCRPLSLGSRRRLLLPRDCDCGVYHRQDDNRCGE